MASPIFQHVGIVLGLGKVFVIEAPEATAQNQYIQHATLNGQPLDRAWLTHAEIVAGGKLVLKPGAEPAHWGRQIPRPAKYLTK